MDQELEFVQALAGSLRVAPGREVVLARDFDPSGIGRLVRKKEAPARLQEGIELLVGYQERLWAGGQAGVLLVLQGVDASGKDSTIKHVMSGVNPQGVEVRSFKQPSSEELAHDLLWRYQRDLPARGRIGIYNRSHYEEVLVVRVHPELLAAEGLPAPVPPELWARRFRDINAWEQSLVDSGISVVKVFLHLSKAEQARRFLRRIDHPEKRWKFSPADLAERAHFEAYQRALEEMLSRTSTSWAPWHVIPADRRWFARLATAAVLVEALAAIDPSYPPPAPEVLATMEAARRQLEAEARD